MYSQAEMLKIMLDSPMSPIAKDNVLNTLNGDFVALKRNSEMECAGRKTCILGYFKSKHRPKIGRKRHRNTKVKSTEDFVNQRPNEICRACAFRAYKPLEFTKRQMEIHKRIQDLTARFASGKLWSSDRLPFGMSREMPEVPLDARDIPVVSARRAVKRPVEEEKENIHPVHSIQTHRPPVPPPVLPLLPSPVTLSSVTDAQSVPQKAPVTPDLSVNERYALMKHYDRGRTLREPSHSSQSPPERVEGAIYGSNGIRRYGAPRKSKMSKLMGIFTLIAFVYVAFNPNITASAANVTGRVHPSGIFTGRIHPDNTTTPVRIYSEHTTARVQPKGRTRIRRIDLALPTELEQNFDRRFPKGDFVKCLEEEKQCIVSCETMDYKCVYNCVRDAVNCLINRTQDVVVALLRDQLSYRVEDL